MAIEAAAGGAESNSYVTLAEATSYFETRISSEAWLEHFPADHEAALITAAARIDQEAFLGRKSDSDQALEFPRDGETSVPVDVKRAQMELALALLEDDLLADTGLEAFEEIEVGPIRAKLRSTTSGKLPAHVRRFLADYLGTSRYQFTRVRA